MADRNVAADRWASCGTYFWEINNLYFSEKHTSPAFNFLGGNWMLYSRIPRYLKGQQIEILLQRIIPYDKLLVRELNVTISLIDWHDNVFCEQSICIAVDSLKEWTVWREELSKIKQHFRCFDRSLTVFCSLHPKNKWSEIFTGKDKEDMKISLTSGMHSLRQDFGKMFDNQVQADVILNCQDEKIHAHRLILSSRSEVFAAMFQNNMKESQTGYIEIIDAEPSILKRFLRYLYVGEIPNLTPVTALKIYILADKYGVYALKRCCAFYLMDNAENHSLFIDYTAPDDENWRMALRPELANIKAILHTENWKSMTEEQTKTSMELFNALIKDAYCKICAKLSSS